MKRNVEQATSNARKTQLGATNKVPHDQYQHDMAYKLCVNAGLNSPPFDTRNTTR